MPRIVYTDAQMEVACRDLCDQRGELPDQIVPVPTVCGSSRDGFNMTMWVDKPQWQKHIGDIQMQIELFNAVEAGLNHN